MPNSMIRDFKERKLDSLRQTKDKRRAAAFRELDISKAENVRSVEEWEGGERIDRDRGRVKTACDVIK